MGTVHGMRISVDQRHHSHPHRRSGIGRSLLPHIRHDTGRTRFWRRTFRQRACSIHHLAHEGNKPHNHRAGMEKKHTAGTQTGPHPRKPHSLRRPTHNDVPARRRLLHPDRSHCRHKHGIRRPVRQLIQSAIRLFFSPRRTQCHKGPTAAEPYRDCGTAPVKRTCRHEEKQPGNRHVPAFRLLRLRHSKEEKRLPTVAEHAMRSPLQTRNSGLRRSRTDIQAHQGGQMDA